MPTFYDKLLCVPLLNLAVPGSIAPCAPSASARCCRRLGLDRPARPAANLAHMAAWIVFFGVMTAMGAADGMHKGDSLPFWEQACAADKPQACARLLRIEASYCGDNAGWACNELGRHYPKGGWSPPIRSARFGYFSRACEARFQAGCVNLLDPSTPQPRQSARVRSAVAVARGRTEPDRDARAGALRARVPARLGVRVRAPTAARLKRARRRSRVARGWLAAFAPDRSRVDVPRRALDCQLPDFVEIPAGPFTMGADPARDPRAFDNEKWSPAAGEGTVDLPAFYIAGTK